MRKTLITVLAASIGLGGFAGAANAGLFSATGQVIAILAGDLFVGEAEGRLSGAGTLTIHSQRDPALTCRGEFTSSAALGGSGKLLCNDGTTADFQFKRLTVFRGFGTASTSRGPLSFTYGIPPAEAQAYLRLPDGKKLAQNGSDLAMVDQ